MSLFPENTVAIIPAAGTKRGGDDRVSDAMTTVAGKPAIFWTMQALIANRIKRVVIVIKQVDNDLEKFVRLMYSDLIEVSFVVPDHNYGVGYSVACGALSLTAVDVPTLVVLGDTILTTWDIGRTEESWIQIAEVDDQSRWCMVEIDEKLVVCLHNKPRERVNAQHACTGVYFFRNGLVNSQQVVGSCSSNRSAAEMSDHLLPLIAGHQLSYRVTNHWLDVGNSDHLQDARKKLLQSRSFNTLSLDQNRGTITKRSTYTSKFYDEINYFKLLPDNLSVYFPRVLSNCNLPNEQHITMEYYAYPTLADLFLFEEMPIAVWRKIFSRLKFICDDFSQYSYGKDSGTAQAIYVEKNITRLESYLAAADGPAAIFLKADRFRVNGITVPSPQVVIDVSKPLLSKIATDTMWTPIHGDLCFSNILCEPDSCLIKLIDPRGSFGKQGVLGDIRYDIAKLAHSIIGRYDFIVNDLFSVTVTGPGEISLDLPFRADMKPIIDEFEAVFLEPTKRSELLLITAWLFLSMLPLHSDNPRRQLAMLATGLKIFSETQK